MLRRTAFPIVLAFWVGFSAFAQSYQTSFSEVKFDRAKGPATFHSGVEVDAASGAASMNLPFGPGIGGRGLTFRPMLTMRLAPQLGISSTDENVLLAPGLSHSTDSWGIQTIDTLYQRGFGSASISPGSLDLGTMVSPVDNKPTSYSLPGGGGGRALGQVPAGVTSTLPALLGKFGFGSEYVIGYKPGSTLVALADRTPFVEMGSSGHLIVGLRAAGTPNATTGLTDEVMDDIQEYPYTSYRWHFPRRMVVIEGDVAYEFHYVNHS